MALVDDLAAQLLTAVQRASGGALGAGQNPREIGRIIGEEAGQEIADRVKEVRQSKETSSFYTSVRSYNKLVKNQSKSIDRLNDQMNYGSRFLEQAINTTESWERLSGKLPNEVNKLLTETGSMFANKVNDFGDVINLNDTVDVMTKTVSAMEGLQTGMSDHREVFDSLLKIQQQGGNLAALGLAENKIRAMNDALENNGRLTKKQTKRLYEQSLPRLAAEMDAAGRSIGKASNNMVTGLEGTRNALLKWGKGLRDSFFSTTSVVAQAGIAVGQFANDVTEAMRLGTEGLQQLRGITMMMDPADISRMQAANKQASLAVGGAERWLDEVADQQKRWALLTGNMSDGARAAAGSFTVLRSIGMDAAAGSENQIRAQDALLSSFKNLQKMTSMTAEEFVELQKELVADQDHRVNLMKMGKQERIAYIDSINKRLQENVQLGMTIEQAKEVEKTFAAMRGKGPRERMKAAARLQMVGGAMGMDTGGRLFELMRKGKRTAGEEKELQELTRNMNTKIADMAGSSDMSQQLLAEILLAKSPELQGIFGQTSANTEKMTEGLRISDEQLKQTHVIAESNSTIAQKTVEIKGALDVVANSPLIKGFGAVAALTGMAILSKVAVSQRTTMIGLLGKMAGVSGLSKVGKAAGALGAGAVGYVAGEAIYDKFGADILDGVDRMANLFGKTMNEKMTQLDKDEQESQMKAIEARNASEEYKTNRLEQSINQLSVALSKVDSSNQAQIEVLQQQLDVALESKKELKKGNKESVRTTK